MAHITCKVKVRRYLHRVKQSRSDACIILSCYNYFETGLDKSFVARQKVSSIFMYLLKMKHL